MKRWGLLLAVILLLLVCLLGQTAMDPEDYSGEWYSGQEQCIYRFEEGIIYCQKYPILNSEGEAFSGAYTYCADSVFLFASGIEGLETSKELYLVKNKEETVLCENKDGSGKIYFVRDNRKK